MRRPAKAILAVSVLLVLAAMAGLMALERSETVEEEYATYAEAIGDGFAARGWMPDYVPPSATRIRAAHNLDTNRQWLAFELPPEALARLLSLGRRVTELPPSYAPSWLDWWQSGLEDGEDASLVRVVLHGAVERPERGVRCLAADLQERQVFAWSCDAASAA